MGLHDYKDKPVSRFAALPGMVTFWKRVAKSDGCWEWSGPRTKDGYGHVNFKANGRNTAVLAHRVSYFLTHWKDPDGLVLHKCANRACVRPEHLYLGTHEENMRDGSLAGNRKTLKLSYEAAAEARRIFAGGGVTKTQLAVRFGVARTTMNACLYGWTFKHKAAGVA